MRRVQRLAAAGFAIGLGLAGVGQAAEVAGSPREIRPLMIGAEVPKAEIKKGDGTAVALDELLAKQPTIMILYRGGW